MITDEFLRAHQCWWDSWGDWISPTWHLLMTNEWVFLMIYFQLNDRIFSAKWSFCYKIQGSYTLLDDILSKVRSYIFPRNDGILLVLESYTFSNGRMWPFINLFHLMKLRLNFQVRKFANIPFYQHADTLTSIKLLAVLLLAKDVSEKCMLAKKTVCWCKLIYFHEQTFHQHTEKISST